VNVTPFEDRLRRSCFLLLTSAFASAPDYRTLPGPVKSGTGPRQAPSHHALFGQDSQDFQETSLPNLRSILFILYILSFVLDRIHRMSRVNSKSTSRSSVLRRDERLDLRDQRRQVVVHCVPDYGQVDARVLVDEQIGVIRAP